MAKPQACPLRIHNPVGHPKNNLALMKSMDSAVTREIWATVEHREGNEAGWGKNGRQGLPKSISACLSIGTKTQDNIPNAQCLHALEDFIENI